MTTYSEPALNVLLAELLSKRGLLGASELVVRHKKAVRKPDVLMVISGVRVILEGKLSKASAKEELQKQCVRRIEEGLSDVSVGVVYKLVKTSKLFLTLEDMKDVLLKSSYEVSIWTPSKKEPQATIGWVDVDIDGLARLIRSTVNEVASTDLLKEAVDELRSALEKSSITFFQSASRKVATQVAEQLASAIEVPRPKNDDERVRTVKMSMLVLADASIFYEVVGPGLGLASLDKLKEQHGTWLQALRVAYTEIYKINYEPVFELSLRLLDILPMAADKAIETIVEVSKFIAASKALLKHDLMGRVYHKLLFEDIAKHLATYYTSVPAAWILARVALETKNDIWREHDWSNAENLKKLRMADLACGSGTLLSATYRTLQDKHIFGCVATEKDPDLGSLHKAMLEEAIYGFDVMTYAAHIATLTLALHNPDSIFTKSNIFVLPLGTVSGDLGSIEFLKSPEIEEVRSLKGSKAGPTRYSIAEKSVEQIRLEPHSLDLVIMNPPFARSCGDNLLFGNIEDKKIRDLMKARLTSLLKNVKFTGIGQAGLGAVFVVIADKYVKRGGRIAFVLPRNILSGVSWQKIRELLSTKPEKSNQWIRGGYQIEYVLLSAEPGSYNFSENTDLSECLLVAKKLKDDEEPSKTLVVIFHRKPRTVFESLVTSRQLIQYFEAAQSSDIFDLFSNSNAWPDDINIGNEAIGKVYSINLESVEENRDNWGRLVAFANPELTKITYSLRTLGELVIPRGTSVTIPLKKLEHIAQVGPDRKQIHNVFRQVERGGIINSLWGRKMTMNQMKTEPNRRLAAKAGAKINKIVKTASNLLVAERVWLDTTPLVSLYCTKPVLSNVWWSINPLNQKSISPDEASKILTLWLNSTPGLLTYISELEVTRGGWAAIKKATLEKMSILDIASLERNQVEELLELFDKLSSRQVPLLKEQFEEASMGRGWREELDRELLRIIGGKKVKGGDLLSLYDLLKDEAKHWETQAQASKK